MNAVSASGLCTINIHATYRRQSSWARLIRALVLGWENLIIDGALSRGRYEVLEFEMVYDGVQIWEGHSGKLPAVSGASERPAVARRR